MPNLSPTAVTVKINKTSVMLYASRYQDGASVQRYLASFPITATEVPAGFEVLLRQATRRRPERYQALMARITQQALVPARARRERVEAERQRAAVAQALAWATQALRDLPGILRTTTCSSGRRNCRRRWPDCWGLRGGWRRMPGVAGDDSARGAREPSL